MATPKDAPKDPATDQLARELPRLIERMHRRYLDVVRIGLEANAAGDISPVQFMMLQTICSSEGEISVRDLVARGYYLGSNASYNLKQLVERGYVERNAAARDRRTARLKMTARGSAICAALRTHDAQIFVPLQQQETEADIAATHRLLRALERRWSEAIHESSREAEPDSGL